MSTADAIRYLPPMKNARFWYVQLLVLGIAGFHDVVEVAGIAHLGMLYFLPVSLFFVPVVYAALSFGFPGAVATALWATVITVPNWIFWHVGFERWGVIFQMCIVDGVGIFVGHRVELERRARRQAERMGSALKASEARYRGLFATSGEAVLVVDAEDVVREANRTAGELFDKKPGELQGWTLDALVARETGLDRTEAYKWRSSNSDLVYRDVNGQPVHLQPIQTSFTDQDGAVFRQIILRDITEHKRKEEGLRSYAAQIMHAQEEERKRIAQELHDETVQALILICRQLEEIEEMAQNRSPDTAESVATTRDDVLEIAASLRRIMRGLRPPVLDDLGLVPAVGRLAADLEERTGMRTACEIQGRSRRVDGTVELGLFRIAQEALHNIERHAHAKGVHLELRFDDDGVRLVISDDGVGFHVPSPGEESPTTVGGFGVVGMRERTRLLGGELHIQSEVGEGTVIDVRVPDHPQRGGREFSLSTA